MGRRRRTLIAIVAALWIAAPGRARAQARG